MNIQTLTKDKELNPCPSWMGKTFKLGAVSLFAMNLCVAPTVFAGTQVHSPKNNIFINNVFVDPIDQSMKIVGHHFGLCTDGTLKVKVKRFDDEGAFPIITKVLLPITKIAGKVIRTGSLLPDLLDDGNYRMIVRCKGAEIDNGDDSSSGDDVRDDSFAESFGDVFDFTIGAVGPKGDQGDQGKIGDTGAAGADGGVGATGADGADGATGATGATGAAGAAGADGATGATGATGADGMDGAKGDKGVQGKRGEAGPSTRYTDAFAVCQYKAAVLFGAPGSCTAVATCELGQFVTGGGYTLVGTGRVTQNEPGFANPPTWNVRCVTGDILNGGSCTSTAICEGQ